LSLLKTVSNIILLGFTLSSTEQTSKYVKKFGVTDEELFG